MNTIIMILGFGLLIAVLLIAMGVLLLGAIIITEGDVGPGAAFIVAALVLGPLIAVGGCRVVLAGERGFSEQSCENFADATGYTARLIITTAWDSGSCYVDFDGQWVPKDQLWAEMRGPG